MDWACLWDVVHEDYVKRDKRKLLIVKSMQSAKVFYRLLRKAVCLLYAGLTFVSGKMFSCVATGAEI